MSHPMKRSHYADIFGPTTGDRSGSATPGSIAEVERDSHRLRRRMQIRRRQSAARRHGPGGRRRRRRRARLRDHQRARSSTATGIYKADIGIKARPHRRHRQGRQSRRHGRRHAGHDRRRHDRRRSPAKGMIVTAGGIDAHIHFICPQQVLRSARQRRDDLHRRRHRARRPERTPRPARPVAPHLQLMLQATDDLPMNIGFTGKGNTSIARRAASTRSAPARSA